MPEYGCTIAVDREKFRRLLRLSNNCAEDLLEEIKKRRPDDHPVTVRARDRESAEALELLEVVTAINEQFKLEY